MNNYTPLPVDEYLEMSKDREEIFVELGTGNSFWENSYSFFKENEHTDFRSLTMKQQNWIEKILEGIDKEQDKRMLQRSKV